MTVPAHFHVPGAFHPDGTTAVHPGLFRPPMPSPTPTESGTAKRKRLRDDVSRPSILPVSEPDFDGEYYRTSTTPAVPGSRSYVLAGQIDTPNGGPSENGILGESMYSDSDYRRVLGSKRTRDDLDAGATGPTPLFDLPPQPMPANQGWGAFAVTTIGGVVGKVWQFCKAGAFKGFHAGGGQGYSMEIDGSLGDVSMFDSRTEDYQNIPGRFPQGETDGEHYIYDPYVADERNDSSRATTPSRPAIKRRQTEQTDDLGRNWVVVNEPRVEDRRGPRRPPSHRPSPRNRNHAPSVATGRRISTPTARLSTNMGSPRRPASRSTFHDTPIVQPPRPASSASYASPRSPSPTKIPKATTTTSPAAYKSSSQPIHTRRRTIASPSAHPPPLTHRRTHSGASTASPRKGEGASPRLDAEARKLAARRKMEDREADVRMVAMSKRLEDMIRQGKEALGTTVTVDGGVEGAGRWEDE